MKPRQLAKTFNQDIKRLDSQAQRFLQKSDPANTQALRKATKRLRSTYSVLPKNVRAGGKVERYAAASEKLGKAIGRIRDIDTISIRTAQVADAKDQQIFSADLQKLRDSALRKAQVEVKALRKAETPSLEASQMSKADIEKRVGKVQKRISRRVDKEFEEFLSTQEVDVMHALRKDAKKLRQLLELSRGAASPTFLRRLKSIQDELGAIRDHDLAIDYLQSRVRLESTRALVREEIAKRHARLEDFVTKNRGQGHLVPFSAKSADTD